MEQNNKVEINLYDSLMGQHNYRSDRDVWSISGAATDPQIIKWNYLGGSQKCAVKPAVAPKKETQITVFTEKDMLSPWVDRVKSEYKVLFMHECRGIHPQWYNLLEKHPDIEKKFDYIVTHDEVLLNRDPKYLKLSSNGSSWIPSVDAKIYKKKKLLSHIVSKQNWARGHKLRHIVAKAIKGRYEVDMWGSAIKPFETKLDPLKDYMFSITIMNSDNKNYFTETLVDTFRCGTVPIFWGCPNIEDYFNTEGMLIFKTGPELISILDSLSPELYEQKLPYVKENFETAKNHCQVDDQVYKAINGAIKNVK
tara:strand:- start:66 stop:992 length:927 start_codon:yes stop_codon:yes gene_type:complete